ncbi:response regulator [Qipengyuania nanhaisediminis]|uniref:response regulator n=1 Tax=Qipengyuania nanhaisediminis TaxID=604088 RepID=UPI0038B3A76C
MAHILIADDDELIAELASQVLIDAGHACGWVTSGEDAWALLKTRRPDVLLLDQDMPGMSGVTLLRRLRQSEEFYDLPVIMFTAMSGTEDESQAIYAGAQDFVRKPFDPRGLTGRVQRVLARRVNHPRHKALVTHLREKSGMSQPIETRERRFI